MTSQLVTIEGGGPLIGREPELQQLEELVHRATAQGGCLLVTSEPGLGRTKLLNTTAALASAAGSRVVCATGVESQAEVAFHGLEQLLTPLAAEVDALSATYRAALAVALGLADGPVPERLVLSNAVLATLRQAARSQPLVVLVDDVHWLDQPSADVLAFTARRLIGTRVGVVVAARTGQARSFEQAGLPELELAPLDPESSAAVVAGGFPTLARSVQQRVLTEADGNPLALLELPAALTPAQRTAEAVLPEVLPLSHRLATVFASRVVELPEVTRDVLLLMALEGSGDLGVLHAAAAGGDLTPLDVAERARLVSVSGATRRADFRHPLVRSTVVGLATDPELRQAHRALAQVLGDQPDRRAWHLAEATREPDEEVADLLEQAGHRMLERGDAIAALAALQRSAELSPDGLDKCRRLLEAAYQEARISGGLRQAAELLGDVREAEPELISSLPKALAASYLLLNSEAEVDSTVRLLVAAVGAHLDAHEVDASGPVDKVLDDALHVLVMMCWVGRPELWQEYEAVLDRLGDRASLAQLSLRAFGDPVHRAAPVLDQVTAVVDDLQDELDPLQITRVGIICVYVDRLGDCREALARVVEAGRRGGAVVPAINALVSSCADAWQTGRWDEARDLAGEVAELAAAYGYRRYSSLFAGFLEALVGAARGDADAALAAADDLTAWSAPRRADIGVMLAHHLRAVVALGREDFETAYRELTAISPAGTLPAYTPHVLWTLLDLVEAAVQSGRHEEAAAHVAAMRAADVAAISPRLAFVSAAAAGMVAPDAEAFDLFEQALAVPGAERWPFDLARVRLAYGERLRRGRSGAAARTQLDAALTIFRQLRARPWVVRTSNELRAMGGAGPRIRVVDPAPITPQERQIAMLAASGLTNKQIGARLFLSHRTVGARLYQVFPKLGVSSRAALRDALAALPAGDRATGT